MELEISPEPTDAERRAIELALADVLADPAGAPPPSAWHAQGVRENTEGADPD